MPSEGLSAFPSSRHSARPAGGGDAAVFSPRHHQFKKTKLV